MPIFHVVVKLTRVFTDTLPVSAKDEQQALELLRAHDEWKPALSISIYEQEEFTIEPVGVVKVNSPSEVEIDGAEQCWGDEMTAAEAFYGELPSDLPFEDWEKQSELLQERFDAEKNGFVGVV